MAEVTSYTRLWPLAVAAVGVVGLVYAAVKATSDPAPDDFEGADAPEVDPGPNERFEKVRKHFVDDFSTFRGRVRAGSPFQVRVPAGMRVPISKIHREPGTFVKKGDLLVSFHRPQIDKAIEKALAEGRTADAERFRGYLDYVELKAERDGVVGEYFRTLGEVPIDEGIPVLTLQDKDSYAFVVPVPGDVQRTSMPLGSKFKVELEAEKGVVEGTVTEFEGGTADSVSVVLALAPHEGIEDQLAGEVRVATGRIEAGLIPKTAVTMSGPVPTVRAWDPVSKSIETRTLRLGEEVGPDVVVLAGVFEGDTVLVPGRP